MEAGETATFEQTVVLMDEGAEMVGGGQLVQVEQPDAPEDADFSSTACVYQTGADQALICGSSWHELSEGTPAWLWWIIGVVVVLALLAALFYLTVPGPALRPLRRPQAKRAAPRSERRQLVLSCPVLGRPGNSPS